ncbi:MAG: 4Fe-4S single cluster domain-containing protein, partial [Pyrinomonadaceae bacterium]
TVFKGRRASKPLRTLNKSSEHRQPTEKLPNSMLDQVLKDWWDPMSKELVLVLEPDVARVTVEISQASKQTADELANVLGARVNLNCAKPADDKRYLPVLQGERSRRNEPESDSFSIWLYRLYHNSVVDGPGRRSVVQVSGCSLRCIGCTVPQTHQIENGKRTSISSIITEIVARREEHDGVTILGGEPFDQPESVAELVSRLKGHGLHVTVYSGFTIGELIQKSIPSIDYILSHIDLLIDGPFFVGLRDGAGEYRGSKNQNLIPANILASRVRPHPNNTPIESKGKPPIAMAD